MTLLISSLSLPSYLLSLISLFGVNNKTNNYNTYNRLADDAVDLVAIQAITALAQGGWLSLITPNEKYSPKVPVCFICLSSLFVCFYAATIPSYRLTLYLFSSLFALFFHTSILFVYVFVAHYTQ